MVSNSVPAKALVHGVNIAQRHILIIGRIRAMHYQMFDVFRFKHVDVSGCGWIWMEQAQGQNRQVSSM